MQQVLCPLKVQIEALENNLDASRTPQIRTCVANGGDVIGVGDSRIKKIPEGTHHIKEREFNLISVELVHFVFTQCL
jgi:hypothetical protein